LPRWRLWIYAAIVIALVGFRVVPGLRSRLPGLRSAPSGVEKELVIAGSDTAPQLISAVTAFYRTLYPELQLSMRPGGTIEAIEDLLNRRADVAFLSRPLSASEDSVVRSVGDSLLLFPIALAGTIVLAPGSSGIDSLSVDDLRGLLTGRWSGPAGLSNPSAWRVYVPDPRTGLWGAIARQLDLPDSVSPQVTWLRDEREVVRAVARDASAIGLVSSLAVSEEEALGCRRVRIVSAPGSMAAEPVHEQVATGDYPLYHHLYAGCRVGAGSRAYAFATFINSEQGQTLVRREGFLPAREIAREIQLSQRPLPQ
jgi:phosphate transport system substrate-binding protein